MFRSDRKLAKEVIIMVPRVVLLRNEKLSPENWDRPYFSWLGAIPAQAATRFVQQLGRVCTRKPRVWCNDRNCDLCSALEHKLRSYRRTSYLVVRVASVNHNYFHKTASVHNPEKFLSGWVHLIHFGEGTHHF